MNLYTAPLNPRKGPASLSGVPLWLRWPLRLVAVAAAFVFMLVALVLGMLLALGLVGWALVRGRRPATGLFHAYYQRARHRQRPGDKTIIDIDAVEVPDPQPGVPQR